MRRSLRRTFFRPEYGHPRVFAIPISKTLVICASRVTLTQIAKAIWEGDAHITRVLEMEIPSHCDTGLLPQKGKRNLNGEQPCAGYCFFFFFFYYFFYTLISCNLDSNVERTILLFFFCQLLLQFNFENKLTKKTTSPSPNFPTGIWLQR